MKFRTVSILCAVVSASSLYAETSSPSVQPAVDFPATPTPRPSPTPLSAEALEAHFLPRELPTDTPSVLALVYSGNRRSQIGPCGCVSKQLGGIDKEGRLGELLKEKNVPTVKVDAGGYLKDVFTEFEVARTKAILRAWGLMGFNAVNVAYTDLGFGVKTLKETAEAANVPLVSANIVDANGDPVFDPYRVQTVKLRNGEEVRVGFIGVTRPRYSAGMAPRWTPTPASSQAPATTPTASLNGEHDRSMGSDAGAQTGSADAANVGDPVEALRKYLPELKEKSDLIILLSYGRRDNVRVQLQNLGELARAIDIAVAGEYNATQTGVQMEGTTRMVSGGYEGRQVGLLLLDMAAGKISRDAHKWIEIEQSIPSVPELKEIVDEAKAQTTGQLGGIAPAPGNSQGATNAGYLNVR